MLTVLGGGKVRLDQADLDIADLPEHLRALLARSTPGVAFVKGENEIEFAQVAEVSGLTGTASDFEERFLRCP